MERMKLSVSGVIIVMLALVVPVFSQSTELPVQGLEGRIDFWKKVFTQYGEDDVIIHDRNHPNLIYDVATRQDQTQKISTVQKALDEISANLANPQDLSAAAQQVHTAIGANGIPVKEASLKDLRDNVHTQVGIKERFRQGVIRSGRYVEAFQGIFEKQGLPPEIALLPLVESSFENRALSNAGAAGIWQFTRGTGRLYLNVNKKVDERLDPAKATRAAARLLHDNYVALGSWPLVESSFENRALSNAGAAGIWQFTNDDST